MFVSSLYNYATGSSSSPAKPEASTPSNTRVKRHPIRKKTSISKTALPTSPPPSYASVASGRANTPNATNAQVQQQASEEALRQRTATELAKIAVIDSIVELEDLYQVLGVRRNAKTDEIRRGFLNRSRTCHPDKFPSYAPCVVAFQKVSFAYQTLSNPSSRRLYDVSGRMDLAAALNDQNGQSSARAAAGLGGDETLNSVLYSVFCEFLDGDFEMIRVLVNAMNESNPGLNLGEDAVDSIEGAFAKLREIMLAGKKYLTIIRFELIRLYEIQHSLRQLSYFDVFGRLRLTLQLARVTLSIPMAIDQAMKEPEEEEEAAGEEGNASHSKEEGNVGLPGERQSRDIDEEEDAVSNSSEEDEAPSSKLDFGMRADEEDSENEEIPSSIQAKSDRRRARRARQRASRRARVEAARKSRIEEQELKALQRKGLLGPTAASLLKGVVKVLETSEGWVPGKSKQDSDE